MTSFEEKPIVFLDYPFSLNAPMAKKDFLNQELAYGSDIDIGRSGPSLLLDFDDLPAGGSSKVGERDRKLTSVGAPSLELWSSSPLAACLDSRVTAAKRNNGSNESKSGNEAGVSAKRDSGFRVWYVWIVAQNRA
ncbi:hypothetical protein NE237_014281 [Protea cynaroides]|uniref:Uncharacterized protein n=1 Tax=Protea cynaroides TaxID=273540 RepID=A0A9Q0JTG4_9MAGN|nr:hypothetical protein NE237_014281 [Protea cynaroides]